MLLLLLVSFCPQRWRGLQHFERAIDAVDFNDSYGSGLASMSSNAFNTACALAEFSIFAKPRNGSQGVSAAMLFLH